VRLLERLEMQISSDSSVMRRFSPAAASTPKSARSLGSAEIPTPSM